MPTLSIAVHPPENSAVDRPEGGAYIEERAQERTGTVLAGVPVRLPVRAPVGFPCSLHPGPQGPQETCA